MGEVKLTSIGTLQKGRYVVIDGAACIVTDTKTSRPGKHGHAKVNMMAVGMIDGKKRNIVLPGHDNIEVPVIEKKNAQILSVTGESANVMDMETYETFDLPIPDELKETATVGATIIYWIILDDKVMKALKTEGTTDEEHYE